MSLRVDGEADTPNDVIRYTDSNFAKSKPDQKLTGGYVLMLGEAAISHCLNFNQLLHYLFVRQSILPYVKQGKKQFG